MRTTSFRYSRPDGLDDALQALSDDGTPLAGGQSLLQTMKLRLREPAHLVDLAGVDGLDGLEEHDGGLAIGALVTIREIATSPVVRAQVPWLADAASRVGDVQVRNRGTLGGNICFADPRSNLASTMISLGGRVRVAGMGGERELPVAELFAGYRLTSLRPGELVTALIVPGELNGARGAYLELSRQPNGVPIVNACVTVRQDGSFGIGVGGLADRPLRASGVEAALGGGSVEQAVEALDRNAAEALEDMHGSAVYRLRVARVLVRRAVRTAMNGGGGSTHA